MKRIRMVGLGLLAVFAMGAIAATAAQAAEAPYWGVESKRLVGGEAQEVTVNQISEYTLTGGALAVTCKESKVNAGGTLNGSNAGEPGFSKERITFELCTIAGDGTECMVGHDGNREVVTSALKDELVYDAASKESKSVAVEFTPETGAILAQITLSATGAGKCEPVAAGVLSIVGQVVGKPGAVKRLQKSY